MFNRKKRESTLVFIDEPRVFMMTVEYTDFREIKIEAINYRIGGTFLEIITKDMAIVMFIKIEHIKQFTVSKIHNKEEQKNDIRTR